MVLINSKILANKLQDNGHGYILIYYDQNGGLLSKHVKTVIHTSCQIGFEKFTFKLGKQENVRELASAICQLFPLEFPNISTLLPIRGRTGQLYNCALNKVKLEKKNIKDLTEQNEQQSKNDHEVTEKGEELLEYLKTSLGNEKLKIENALQKTKEIRLNLEPSELLFNFFITHPGFINFEFQLNFPNYEEQFESLFQMLKLEILLKINGAIATKIHDYPHGVQPFVSLLKMIGGYQAGKNRRSGPTNENFASAVSRFFVSQGQNVPNSTIFTSTTNTQPFIVGKYDTDETNVIQYFLFVQPKVIPLDPDMPFEKVFDLLFKIYHVFRYEYPIPLQKFYYFFEEHGYNLKRHKIPKNLHIFHKIKSEFEKIDTQLEVMSNEEIIEEPIIESMSNVEVIEEHIVEVVELEEFLKNERLKKHEEEHLDESIQYY